MDISFSKFELKWTSSKVPSTFQYFVAQPSAPTPLLQASGMCIKPQRGNCRPRDGTILVLTQTKPCDQPFMQFALSADGSLKHHCSGKLVCPRKPAQGKRCELMISSKCQPQTSKFERTAGKPVSYLLQKDDSADNRNVSKLSQLCF